MKILMLKKKDIKYYESKGCKLNQNINSCVTIPNSSGWKLPLTSAWVTSEYQVVRTDCIGCGGVSHRGIDLGQVKVLMHMQLLKEELLIL